MGVDHGRSQTARRAARRPDIAAAPRSHIARIRHGVSWEAEAATLRPNPNTTHAGMLADKKFREGIAVVGRLGLSYDVSLYHTQIGEVADLAGALPNTRIVVNHVGGVLGNFPVDKISYSYPVFWNACKLMAKGASSSEKADLFAGSAARCYQLIGLV